MKTHLVLLLWISLSNCVSKPRTIVFINRSGFEVDSLRIGVSSAELYPIKLDRIKPLDSVVVIIPNEKPVSNGHDILVDITVYIKGNKPFYSYYYNDLSGYMSSDYTITLNKKGDIFWATRK